MDARSYLDAGTIANGNPASHLHSCANLYVCSIPNGNSVSHAYTLPNAHAIPNSATPRLVGTPTPTPTPFYGQWETVSDRIDPLTRKRDVRIALPEQGQTFRTTDSGLVVGCTSQGLVLFVLWSTHISDYTSITVAHRIDDGPVESLDWPLSTDNKATYFPYSMAGNMIRDLFDADEFVVQVIPDGSNPLTAVFEPAGLYWALKPVLEACGQEID